ncbi:MAG: PIG-L deacetylase family protein [Ilumatobacteraceae bacterium]
MTDTTPLPALAEDWTTALAIVAHPDDMEYGAASAVARWTRQGKRITYLLVTRGEAGISTMPPAEVGPLRVAEQVAGCAVVGVDDVRFLDHPDGLVEPGLRLRRDLAAAIRDVRPDVVLTINHRDSWGGPSWNHVDHRVVGTAVLDAVRDAANPWVFDDAGPAWDGVRFVAVNGSPQPTHHVDVTDTIHLGVESLRCHRVYLEHLGGDMADPDTFLRAGAAEAGRGVGVEYATVYEVVG